MFYKKIQKNIYLFIKISMILSIFFLNFYSSKKQNTHTPNKNFFVKDSKSKNYINHEKNSYNKNYN